MALIPGTMSTPPVPPPPDAPSLSAYSGGTQGAPPGPPQTGGLMKLFFQAEQTIDSIAAGVPSAAGELDRIKQQLRAVLTNAIQKGAGGTPPPDYSGGPRISGGGEGPIR